MPHDIVIDTSEEGRSHKVARARRRSKRDKMRYWKVRYNAFLKAGFTEEEAAWGANDGLSLKNPTVKKIIQHRKALIVLYIRDYGYPRTKAIQMASKDLDAKLDKANVEEKNLYYELKI